MNFGSFVYFGHIYIICRGDKRPILVVSSLYSSPGDLLYAKGLFTNCRVAAGLGAVNVQLVEPHWTTPLRIVWKKCVWIWCDNLFIICMPIIYLNGLNVYMDILYIKIYRISTKHVALCPFTLANETVQKKLKEQFRLTKMIVARNYEADLSGHALVGKMIPFK